MPTQSSKFQHRAGEAAANNFSRSGRFFCTDNLWYFKTREGLDYGPFNSRTECKYAYVEFIDVVNNENSFEDLEVDFKDNSFVDTETQWTMPKIKFN